MSNEYDDLHRRIYPGTSTDPHMVQALADIRAQSLALGCQILSTFYASRERSLALTALQESVMWVAAAASQRVPVE
jgi:hypothetical protein